MEMERIVGYCSEKDVLFMLLQMNIFVIVILILQNEGHFQKQWDYTSEKSSSQFSQAGAVNTITIISFRTNGACKRCE